MKFTSLEMWQLVQAAPLIIRIEAKDENTSLVFIKFRKSKLFYQNEYYKILDFLGRYIITLDLFLYRNFRRVFPEYSRNLMNNVQLFRRFHHLIMRDEVFDDAQALVPVPVEKLRKAIHLLTYYKYKYSEDEQVAMYREGEGILRQFYVRPGGENA